MTAALPENVWRTSGLDWEQRPWPEGWGLAGKQLTGPLGLLLLGGNLGELAPGRQAYPLHWHAFTEEHLLVLDGVLTVLERTPDGRRRSFQLRMGELVAWPANTGIAHACINRGRRPVRFLTVSDQSPETLCHYPDSGKVLVRGLGGPGIWDGRTPGDDPVPGRDPQQVFAEARAARDAAPVLELPLDQRPHHVAGWDLGERQLGERPRQFFGRPLGRTAGARSVFVNLDRLPPGCHPSPLHRHQANEELLLVMAGSPTLRQVDAEGVETRVRLQAEDVVHWAPGGVAHQLLNEEEDDAVYAVVGTDLRQDVTVFPERGEAYIAALGEVGRLTPTGYFDGEV